MDLKVGDLIVFKKYDDMTENERFGIRRCVFPEFGKVSAIADEAKNFFIEGELYTFSTGSIDYIISNTDDIHAGDEVLVKTTVGESIKDRDYIRTSYGSWISKDDVVGVLKRKEEYFIVQEDYYGMYVNGSEVLVVNKDDAKIYNSRDEANEAAAYMHLNSWEVIPYDD